MLDEWLKSLPTDTPRHVRTDLEILHALPFSFLGVQQVINQIERLSAHLGSQPPLIRRAAINYSLYVRQLDAIQEKANGIRQFCSRDCPRPPVGCCNREHHVILSLSDILIAQPTQNSLHLAYVLTALQNREHVHALEHGRLAGPDYCSHLTATGCTLRIFKSPRCIHYLCPQVEESITAVYGDNATPFLAAMHAISSCVIHTLEDFTSSAVIRAAETLFSREESPGLKLSACVAAASLASSRS